MCEELTASMRETIRSAAKKLTGACRRQFQAEVAMRYCQGSPRRAEETFGWGRDAVKKGLHELRGGISCVDNFSARGRRKTEEKYPEIVCRIEALVEPESQADPKFQTPLAFTRMTAQAVHDQLAADVCDEPSLSTLPAVRTIRDILNRLGYRLRRVRKTRPQKKFPRPTTSSRTSDTCTQKLPTTQARCGFPSTPRPK